ncbi:hypothetical protein [Metabacillus idriensis]|uniref:hypothetical protein n=1 Tax=Metabacillus idriensis TaxID=324768 RepID=UPI003D29BC4E
MSSYNTGKECCTGACVNCKCRDINRFLESVLTLNHALSEAIYEELIAIKEMKNAVSSEFLITLKKDLNNTLKLAMNKEVLVQMLLEEVKDHCDILFFDPECTCTEEQIDCCTDLHEDEKCLYSYEEPARHDECEKMEHEVLKEEKDEVVKSVEEPLKENKKEKKEKEVKKQDSPKELKVDIKKTAKAVDEDKKENQEAEKKEKKKEKQEKTVMQEKEKELPAERIKGKVPEEPTYHDSYKYEDDDEEEETFIIIRSKGRR